MEIRKYAKILPKILTKKSEIIKNIIIILFLTKENRLSI